MLVIFDHLKKYIFFKVFKYKIFNKVFYQSKIPFLLSPIKITSIVFNVFNGYFFVLHLSIFFRCFSIFWSPWPPRNSNFQPSSLRQLFQPSNHCALSMVWDQSSQEWWFWALRFHVWALKYVQMRSYITHI